MAFGIPRSVGDMDASGESWRKQSWIPQIDETYQVRVARLKKELDLIERGQSDGRENTPTEREKTLNEPQLDVCNRVFSGILLLNQFLAEQLGNALGSGRTRAPRGIDRADYGARIKQEADTVFAEHAATIRKLRDHDLEMHRNLRFFVARNKRKTAASYSDSPILIIAILVGLFVVESIANGMLFRDIVTTGLMGGAVLAALISFINIFLGLTAGLYGWRQIGHVSVFNKCLGVVVTLVCHGAALWWNLLVAHFREVAEIAVRSPNYDFDLGLLARQAFDHLHTQGLLGINSLIAWALLGLGIIVHFVAAKEGWDDLADRYPDYKKVDKTAKQARAEFEESLLEMRREARDAASAVVEDAEEECRKDTDRLNFLAFLENLASQREKEVRDSEDEWVSGGTLLLKTYRTENIGVRDATAPPPPYFETYPTASDYRQRRFGGLPPDGEIDEHAQAARAAIRALSELREAGMARVEQNAADLRDLRAEVNEVLNRLDERVDAVKERATNEARDAARDATGSA